MTAMSTVLTEFADNGDSRTYTQEGHTVIKPMLVIQKRKVPVGNQTVAEISVAVISGTVDSESLPVTQKVNFTATVRYPINGASDDVTAMLAVFRDIIAGDEFANAVNTQEWLV